MSLLISVFLVDDDGRVTEQITPDEGMGGFESTRHDLWGSDKAVALGARFLPQLRHDDLWVTPAQLDAFEAEVRRMRQAVEHLAGACGYRPSYVDQRLHNMERACALARTVGGGVVVD